MAVFHVSLTNKNTVGKSRLGADNSKFRNFNFEHCQNGLDLFLWFGPHSAKMNKDIEIVKESTLCSHLDLVCRYHCSQFSLLHVASSMPASSELEEGQHICPAGLLPG